MRKVGFSTQYTLRAMAQDTTLPSHDSHMLSFYPISHFLYLAASEITDMLYMLEVCGHRADGTVTCPTIYDNASIWAAEPSHVCIIFGSNTDPSYS